MLPPETTNFTTPFASSYVVNCGNDCDITCVAAELLMLKDLTAFGSNPLKSACATLTTNNSLFAKEALNSWLKLISLKVADA